MALEAVDLLSLEDKWEKIKGNLLHHKNWSLIVARAQAQLHNNLNSAVAYMIDPMIILNEMVYKGIITYEEMTPDMFAKCKLKVHAVDDIPCIDGRPIWDRQNGEDIMLYRVFSKYLAMPGRNIVDLAKREGVKPRTVDILSKIWHWKFRAKLYDMNESRIIEMSRGRLIATMRNTHQETAHKLFDKCTTYLLKNVDKMEPKDVIALMKEATKLERLSLGLSPDKIDEGEGPSLPQLSVTVNNGLQTQADKLNEDITPENKEEVTEEMARILTVLQSVGGVQHVVDVEPVPVEDEQQHD